MEKITKKIIEYNSRWFSDREYEEQLQKELAEAIMTEFYTYLYISLCNYIVFQIKFWICLFIIFQIIDNLVNYIDSIQDRSPLIEFDEDF